TQTGYRRELGPLPLLRELDEAAGISRSTRRRRGVFRIDFVTFPTGGTGAAGFQRACGGTCVMRVVAA
ncbi:MAG: hypothetical protein ACK6D3_10690, partial [Planctomycetaceae bacterium]